MTWCFETANYEGNLLSINLLGENTPDQYTHAGRPVDHSWWMDGKQLDIELMTWGPALDDVIA